ncbi:NADH:ubiquinone oxidoreductase [Tulasnella sp. 403]|nr:NADH:ubiquinone oxidoreductase [Tulasnella sp. 403]
MLARNLRTVARRLPQRVPLSIPSSSRSISASPVSRAVETSGTVPRPSRWKQAATIFGRVTLVTVIGTVGTFIYWAEKDRHPGAQKPFDPTKKTVVVLGSGWAATSMLKNMDTEEFNVILVSPRNYFLFTPLLPSVAVGTLEPRSIIQSTRYVARHKARRVSIYEAEALNVDPHNKQVTIADTSDIKGEVNNITIPYDILVYAVGAETQTFGIPGVKEHSCFLKELPDAEKLRERVMDCIESAAFPDQSEQEVDRLMHMIVVGGGPTGIEFSGELHDFLKEDLRAWYPELADKLRITLVEALPNVLPMFSRELIQYTESTFKEQNIQILTKTMVKEVKDKSVIVKTDKGTVEEIPYGLLVWAAGNVGRKITRDLMASLPQHQTNKRGLLVDDYLRLLGANDVYAIGDCTATSYAPTAQVASQEGRYLARLLGQLAKKERLEKRLAELRGERSGLPEGPEGKVKVGISYPDPTSSTVTDTANKANSEEIESIVKQLNQASKIRPFHYSHQGSLAYIGSDKAIADLPFFNGNFASGGVATFLFWRSAYVSTLFSLRNRTLVMTDWLKVKLFGR